MKKDIVPPSKSINYPTLSMGDIGYNLINGGATMIIALACPPLAPVAPLFSSIFGILLPPPVTKRLIEFSLELNERITQLENQNKIDVECLIQNENFITISLRAYELLIRNHQEEKIDALRNAVLNSALDINIDDDLQLMFLDYIGSFTTMHIHFLKFMMDPESKIVLDELDPREIVMMKSEDVYGPYVDYNLRQVLKLLYPELRENQAISDQIIKDLEYKGVLAPNTVYLRKFEDDNINVNVTEFGKLFFSFVSPPSE